MGGSTTEVVPTPQTIEERAAQAIPLYGPATRAEAEFSGLDWYGDHLVMLPQFPGRISSHVGGALLALPRAAILDYIHGSLEGPLQPDLIPFDSSGLESRIPGFEGFEAIVFQDQRVYLTIEARRGADMVGYAVSGGVSGALELIVLDADSLVEIPLQGNWDNKSDESLLVAGNNILSFYEVNGEGLIHDPHATQYDSELKIIGQVPVPHLEYRLTDASALDENGRFWVINYFFPGELYLFSLDDPIAKQFGEGPTHAKSTVVERLVEMQYSPAAISFSGNPPLQIQLSLDGQGRNWEGLARLSGMGFLLVTDKFPGSILGFLPYP